MSSAHSHSERKSRVYRRRKFQQYVSTRPVRVSAADAAHSVSAPRL